MNISELNFDSIVAEAKTLDAPDGWIYAYALHLFSCPVDKGDKSFSDSEYRYLSTEGEHLDILQIRVISDRMLIYRMSTFGESDDETGIYCGDYQIDL